MTELERRALMGDKNAQEECTEKDIILPCPICYNSAKAMKWGATYTVDIICTKCEHFTTATDRTYQAAYKQALKEWNARVENPFIINRETWNCGLCAAEIDRFAQRRLGMRYCRCCGRPLTDEAWEELEKRLRG